MPLFPVEIEYKCRRVVWVDAPTWRAARDLADDTSNWADADDPWETGDVRVPRQKFVSALLPD